MAFTTRLKDLFLGKGDAERDGFQQEVRRYRLVDPNKIGYAVLLGSDRLPNDDSPLQSVGVDLREMDNSLTNCRLYVSKPTLANNQLVEFDREVYESVLADVQAIKEYGCFVFYYSGHGNHHGVLTVDGECIHYSHIVRDFGRLLLGTPRVFVFDCCRKDDADDQEITRDLLEQKVDSSLLADTLVCFSTLDFNPSWGIKKTGSFFTTELAAALNLFHQKLPLSEILVQASGRARGRMCSALGNSSNQQQSKIILSQPVFYSFLSATLLLTTSHKSYSTTDYKPSEELKEWLENHLQNLESKGSGNEEQTKDNVLVIHALDISVSDNLQRLCALAGDLEKHNFAVCLDVWRQSDDLSRNSLFYWYTANIALSKRVIVVLSPELTKASCNIDSVLGKVWSAVCTVMSSNETNCKFYPVHLRPEDTEQRLPVFGGTIYNMADSTDCSKLVRHMTGQPIDLPPPGQVTRLGEKQADTSQLPADLVSLYQTKKGYRPVTQSSRAPPKPVPYHSVPQYPPVPYHTVPQFTPTPVPQFTPTPVPQFTSPPQGQAVSSSRLDRSVLDKQISTGSILWLSERIIEWKFVGRYLGLEESDLSRIEQDNAGKMGEQCYQMLHRWQQTTPRATYSTMLEALERAKCGPTLINDFVKTQLED